MLVFNAEDKGSIPFVLVAYLKFIILYYFFVVLIYIVFYLIYKDK